MSSRDGVHGDVLIIGAGVAGLSAALKLSPLKVTVLSNAPLGENASSSWAQGGIAAAVAGNDSTARHAADTVAVTAGIGDAGAIDLITREGPEKISTLMEWGVNFDRSPEGVLSLGREGGHSRRRILHANGDATGKEIMRALIAAVKASPTITVIEGAAARDLIVEDGRCRGVVARLGDQLVPILAPSVVLTTGGIGQLYPYTTNPAGATGSGLAMAALAGAVIADPEFVQFHPTVLETVANPLPLLTEALRGDGAILVDDTGERFMPGFHPDGELAPRDVVARAIWQRRQGGQKVYLDCRTIPGGNLASRFPTVFAYCRDAGLDPERDPLPVVPAVHYHMGGVATDENGRTSIEGLWACGEVASTGAHGGNRLASNSLLEAVVYAAHIAADITATPLPPCPAAAAATVTRPPRSGDPEILGKLAGLMHDNLGLVRDEPSLVRALLELRDMSGNVNGLPAEIRDRITVARLIAAGALQRRESRGSHFRADHPAPDETLRRRTFLTLAEVDTLTDSLCPQSSPRKKSA